MKKTIIMLLLAVSGMATAQKTVKVNGSIDDKSVKELSIYLGEEGHYATQQLVKTPIPVKDGKFSYTTKLGSIVTATLRPNVENGHEYEIYLVPGEKLNLTIKGMEYFYDGSKVYKEMNAADMYYMRHYEMFESWHDAALARYYTAPESEKEAANQAINDSIELKYNELIDAVVKYRKEHIDEEGALLYLSDFDNVEDMYNDLMAKADCIDETDFINKNRVGAFLKSRIEFEEAKRRFLQQRDSIERAKLDAMNGVPAKEFTLNDINGNPLSLSSLRGKYVILDFWGSWCGWCIKGIPDMKTYYNKYKDRLEILGIDCNDSETAWKSAVAKYEIPWLHVYNPSTSTLTNDYNITGYPTKIIIDPNGNINKVIVGEDPDFYTYLDSLLGGK